MLNGNVDGSSGQAEALTVLNASETAAMVTVMVLGTRDVKCDVDATDGLGSWSDVTSGHRDVADIQNGTDTTADACQNTTKTRNLPVGAGEMQPGPVQKPCRHAKHAQTCTVSRTKRVWYCGHGES